MREILSKFRPRGEDEGEDRVEATHEDESEGGDDVLGLEEKDKNQRQKEVRVKAKMEVNMKMKMEVGVKLKMKL